MEQFIFLPNYQSRLQTAVSGNKTLTYFKVMHAHCLVSNDLLIFLGKQRNFPFSLLEKKQTWAFFPIKPSVCADTYLFCFSSPSQSVSGEITALFHGNCQARAGVTGSPADHQTEPAGVQLTV